MVFWAWTEMREISVCSSVSSGCVPPWCVLAGASRLVTCECLPGEDAIWPLTRAVCRTDGVGKCSLSAVKDRSSVDLASDVFFRTNRPPCIGQWCGVRLVVDSSLPVGGSVWLWGETVFLLRNFVLTPKFGKESDLWVRFDKESVWWKEGSFQRYSAKRSVVGYLLQFGKGTVELILWDWMVTWLNQGERMDG
jgi:hypothetical protein